MIATTMTMAMVIHGADAFCPISTTDTARASSCISSSSNSEDATAATSVATLVENLPSVDELQTAPFMKQVQYGSDMTEALAALGGDDDDAGLSDTLRASLSAQLSHSDGIRGFMVSYLTGSYESSTDADGGIDAQEMIATERDPRVLLETVHGLLQDDKEGSDDLVSLMCMNVVMPVAMITMHQDPALAEASRLTAARGTRLLGSVLGAAGSIRANLEAIETVATTTITTTGQEKEKRSDDPLVDYWTKFFAKWGYETPQKEDIAATMKELLSKSS